MLRRRASIGLARPSRRSSCQLAIPTLSSRGRLWGFGGLRGEQGDPAELPQDQLPDPTWPRCHLLYTSVRREANGAGWRTDYPWGERHLLIRLSELTKTRVSWLSKMFRTSGSCG